MLTDLKLALSNIFFGPQWKVKIADKNIMQMVKILGEGKREKTKTTIVLKAHDTDSSAG